MDYWRTSPAGHTTENSWIYKYIIHIFILRRWRVWSRNTVRESSHISFLCGGDPWCVLERQPENTHDMFAWVTRRSLPSLERPADLSPLLERPADLCLQSKITDLIFFSSPMRKYEQPHCLTYFSVYGWLSELTYFRFFFGNLLILSANGNICHYIHRQ